MDWILIGGAAATVLLGALGSALFEFLFKPLWFKVSGQGRQWFLGMSTRNLDRTFRFASERTDAWAVLSLVRLIVATLISIFLTMSIFSIVDITTGGIRTLAPLRDEISEDVRRWIILAVDVLLALSSGSLVAITVNRVNISSRVIGIRGDFEAMIDHIRPYMPSGFEAELRHDFVSMKSASDAAHINERCIALANESGDPIPWADRMITSEKLEKRNALAPPKPAGSDPSPPR